MFFAFPLNPCRSNKILHFQQSHQETDASKMEKVHLKYFIFQFNIIIKPFIIAVIFVRLEAKFSALFESLKAKGTNVEVQFEDFIEKLCFAA